ncbi:hypothetical protein GCM10018953_09120 [Streptosporangium nondiastaticum]|uniref:CBS domain-containing protein n=1 Tax=Streptosporangium nondiastaticum TaxID=35764 RepID=UPI00338B9766
MSSLSSVDPQIAELIKAEERRQADTVKLIASENYVSKAVLEATGTVLTNKYSEGYPGKRYYEGQQVIDQIETLAIERAASVAGDAPEAEVRRAAADSGHLRLLVNAGRRSEVVGVLHVRDLLIRPGESPAELARPAPRLAKTTTISEAVAVLQDAHAHVGLVTDEGGEVAGMVSLTDLVGEILDVRVLAAR